MSTQLFAIYASAVFLLCLTPGPNSLLAITNGLRYGMRKTFFSTLGCATGLVLLIALCLSGLGVLLAASEIAFTVIKWLGAAYLIFLGISLMRTKSSLADAPGASGLRKDKSNTSLFFQGFLIVATNPKVLLFFTAFLPQFYVRDLPFWSQFLVLAGTFVAIEMLVEMCLAGFAGKVSSFAGAAGRFRAISSITGALFVSAGAFLLTMERPE